MCGIAFLYDTKRSHHELMVCMQSALSAMSHRGPDDQGIYHDDSLVVGHRRLSIVDLGGSKQPMTAANNRYILSYNGEIYNYEELRSKLKGKWQFSTNGDTEVLLGGYITYGLDFLKQAEGMWAFALWDSKERLLTLSRDRMGKKPLYYCASPHGIACASELNSLQKLLHTKYSEDLNSTADYFRYGYYLPGCTAYENVNEVLPGHIYTWSPDKSITQLRYWQIPFGNFQGSKQQAIEEVRECLINAVKKRMVADVEVGAFLSGGIDSSLVVSILSKLCNIHPKTFTIGFDDKNFDERKYAQLIATDCKTEHYEKCVNIDDAQRLKDLLQNNVGQPFFDSSMLPTALVSELASEHVKVVLSGDGGDELFSGYQRYTSRNILRWYSRVPNSLRKNLARIIRKLPEPMAHHSRSFLKKAHLFLDIVDRQTTETPYIAPVMYSNEQLQQLMPDLYKKGHQLTLPETIETADEIYRMMYSDAMVYLPQDILLKVDRASMASSIEARAPFLDSGLVSLAFSFPINWHRSIFAGKSFLKFAFKDLLPVNIWERRKQGFAVPVHRWFRESMGEELNDMIGNLPSILNKEFIQNIFNQHKSGGRDHGYRLWALYAYLLWKR